MGAGAPREIEIIKVERYRQGKRQFLFFCLCKILSAHYVLLKIWVGEVSGGRGGGRGLLLVAWI